MAAASCRGWGAGAAPAPAALRAAACAGASLQHLLAALAAGGSGDAAALLPPAQQPPPPAASGALFAAAAVSALNLPPGATARLSIAHAWRFPHYFWYRDAHGGSDNGVRYADTFASARAVARSLNLTAQAAALAAWQGAFAGLPHPLLRDAAHNLFSHLRSSVWHSRAARAGAATPGEPEFRQWEALEFTDWGNPTNGDERHLPYFLLAPDALRSQLLTWVARAQNADGSFYCIIVSGAGDAQYGRGDPCAGAGPHPDDVTMVLVAAYEQLTLRNDSALVAAIYPALRRAFGFYAAAYNASQPWGLPSRVHETYDAVAEAAGVTGEGNAGISLFNALQYLTGLGCMAGLADSVGDGGTAGAARAMGARARAAAERLLFQPAPAFYAGDTLGDAGRYLLSEPSGFPYKSADGLHGAVLAYRLGLGDVLPRLHMQLHQNYVERDLGTAFGLRFDSYAAQNWLMGDHAASALALHWNEADAWRFTLRQLAYFRTQRRDATRATAVIDTDTGGYALLNHYGYALFFYHTLHGFTGQTAHLPRRAIAFSPHHSAFNASTGGALLPVLLGGALGTLALTPASATLTLLFSAPPPPPPPGNGSAPRGALPQALSFLNITVCQHVFLAPPGAPFVLAVGAPPLALALPAPCATASPASASTIGTTEFCALGGAVEDASTGFSQAPLPPPLPAALALPACQALARAHRFCGYQWQAAPGGGGGGACTLVPGGSTCFLVPGGAPPGSAVRTLGLVQCDFSSVYTPPAVVNTSDVSTYADVAFGGGFSALGSAVFSFAVAPGAGALAACLAQARAQQACGALLAPAYSGSSAPAVGSCRPGAPCCMLNPYKGCSVAGGGATPPAWGNCTAVVFGGSGVLP